jgi:porphobilinogen synthase
VNRQFPSTRMRRNRHDAGTRSLVRETSLLPEQLILPIFVTDSNQTSEIKTMPGVHRHEINSALALCESAMTLGINCVALFPHITKSPKDDAGTESINPGGLIPNAIRQIKSRFPDLLIIGDVALDPYTAHGQDGIIDRSGYIVNDLTIEALCKQSLVLVDAGADIVAPSDMMDGRIGRIRQELEANGHVNSRILSYSAKYASAFYGPFRDAVGSSSNLGGKTKSSYQMDPANSHEALREATLDIAEGADFLMVKPAGLYLDVIYRITLTTEFPTFAYQVSGEFASIRFAASAGALNLTDAMLESLISIRRAGACAILTYFAIEAAKALKNGN